MKRLLTLVALGLSCACVLAQDDRTTDPAELRAQIPLLRVARTLKLRPDQVNRIKPLLMKVEEARVKREQTLDTIWQRSEASLRAVDEALIAGRPANKTDLNNAEKAARDQSTARDEFRKVVDAVAGEVFRALDTVQQRMIETPQQMAARERDVEAFGGAASLSEYIAGYAVAMRQLQPDEYESLRPAMGLRLAGRLVAPNDRRFNNAVADVLRILDTVRRLSDAEFSQRQADLPQAVARALGLSQGQEGPRQPVTRDQFLEFVANPRTPEALDGFKPAPPLEVTQ